MDFCSRYFHGERNPDKSCDQSMLRETSYERKIRSVVVRQNFFQKGPQLGLNRLYSEWRNKSKKRQTNKDEEFLYRAHVTYVPIGGDMGPCLNLNFFGDL